MGGIDQLLKLVVNKYIKYLDQAPLKYYNFEKEAKLIIAEKDFLDILKA